MHLEIEELRKEKCGRYGSVELAQDQGNMG